MPKTPARTSLTLPFTAGERAALEADFIEIDTEGREIGLVSTGRPHLADDLKALEDAIQAVALDALYERVAAHKAKIADIKASEAANLARRAAYESAAASRRPVTDPFAHAAAPAPAPAPEDEAA